MTSRTKTAFFIAVGLLLCGCASIADRQPQYGAPKPAVQTQPSPAMAAPAAKPVAVRHNRSQGGAHVAGPSTSRSTGRSDHRDVQYVENLRICLAGTYECHSQLLTAEDRANVAAADYQRNLTICLRGGRYGCRHAELSPDDLVQVREAEYRTILSGCLRGHRYGCQHASLRPDDLVRVREAEYRNNLSACLRGRVYGCRHDELRPEDLTSVRAAEYKVNLDHCLSRYPLRCNTTLLSKEDQDRVGAHNQTLRNPTAPLSAPTVGGPQLR
jgi:hypothetical protein